MRAWENGRQQTGYRKLLLGFGKTWDCYLLDYAPGSHIPTHTDPVAGKRHYRLNIVLKRGRGGHFVGDTLLDLGRIKLFRPDIAPHSLSHVKERRLVLSIGWCRAN